MAVVRIAWAWRYTASRLQALVEGGDRRVLAFQHAAATA